MVRSPIHPSHSFPRTLSPRDTSPRRHPPSSLPPQQPPAAFDAHAAHDQKARALRAIRPTTIEEVARRAVRGQYEAGMVVGACVAGYREERSVTSASMVETVGRHRVSRGQLALGGSALLVPRRHGARERMTETSPRSLRVLRVRHSVRSDPALDASHHISIPQKI